MFHAQALKLDSVGVERPPAQRGEIQMRNLALCVMLFASAAYGQECIRGKILLSTTVCPCTEKVTTIANCWPDGENQYGCESGGHKIICGGNRPVMLRTHRSAILEATPLGERRRGHLTSETLTSSSLCGRRELRQPALRRPSTAGSMKSSSPETSGQRRKLGGIGCFELCRLRPCCCLPVRRA